jgi:hypothetical protein
MHFVVNSDNVRAAIQPVGSIAFGRFGFPYNTAQFTLFPRPLAAVRIEGQPGFRHATSEILPHKHDVLARIDEAAILTGQAEPAYKQDFPLVGQFFVGPKHAIRPYALSAIGLVNMVLGGQVLLQAAFPRR